MVVVPAVRRPGRQPRASAGQPADADDRLRRPIGALVASDDPEARRSATVRAFEELRGVLEHHGGIVEKFIGDAVMAVFGLAQRHEDDALRAVRAALDMQSALERVAPALDAEFGVQLGLRIGVNTGPVIAGDPSLGQRLVTGDAVNVAARLEQTAGPGEVVIGSLTGRLVGDAAVLEPLAPLTLKGKAEPVPASRVLRVVSGPSVRARLELPLVGRERELGAMQDRFQEAVRTQACRRMTIRGDAGIGKSRLVYEMIDRLPETAGPARHMPLIRRGHHVLAGGRAHPRGGRLIPE